MFNLEIENDLEDGSWTGQIQLGDHSEMISSSASFFAREDYLVQWSEALKLAVNKRKITALFYNLELEKNGYGRLWMFPLIPSEMTQTSPSNQENEGIFITQRFLHITTKPENFLKPIYWESDDEDQLEEIPLFFFDLNRMDRIYNYLDENIFGISKWFVSNRDVQDYLD